MRFKRPKSCDLGNGASIGRGTGPLVRNRRSRASWHKEALQAINRSEDLAATGSLVEHALSWSQTMVEAERIGNLHTTALGVRGMGLLNVAAAVTIGAKTFFTFDGRQKALARACGLQVSP